MFEQVYDENRAAANRDTTQSQGRLNSDVDSDTVNQGGEAFEGFNSDLGGAKDTRKGTAEGTESPEPMDLDDAPTMGSLPEEELHSGPDLNPDGSVKAGTETPDLQTGRQGSQSGRRLDYRIMLTLLLIVLTVATIVFYRGDFDISVSVPPLAMVLLTAIPVAGNLS